MNSRMSQSEHIHTTQSALDYWQLFQDLPESYILFEAAKPYIIVELNKAREELLGVPRAAAIGKPLFAVHPPVNQWYQGHPKNRSEELIQKVLRTRKVQKHDALRYDTVAPDHTVHTRYWQSIYVPLTFGGSQVTHILAVTKDVTAERMAMDRMMHTQERLESALAIGKVGSWVWDLKTNKIVADATMAKMFGAAPAEAAKGMPQPEFMGVVHKDDIKRVMQALEKAIKTGELFEEEYRIVDKKGNVRWLIARGRLQGPIEHRIFPGVLMDITERRKLQAEVELARQQDKLNRQASRVLQIRNDELEAIARTKDEFVALASHQLRTPATAVKQYLGMVLQGYVGDISDVQAEMLMKAFESNERQIQIINQILNAARVDTGSLVLTPAPVDVCSLVRGIANDMKSQFDAHAHTLDLHLPNVPMQVEADMGYLRMAIENLVNNAILYTPDGGKITLGVSRAGKRCRLLITDNGVGIRKSDLHKLFIKFSRIHNPLSVQAGGSGIGLYLAAEIVRLHRGTVSVESELGKGTTFAISLPLVQNTTHRLTSGDRKVTSP